MLQTPSVLRLQHLSQDFWNQSPGLKWNQGPLSATRHSGVGLTSAPYRLLRKSGAVTERELISPISDCRQAWAWHSLSDRFCHAAELDYMQTFYAGVWRQSMWSLQLRVESVKSSAHC